MKVRCVYCKERVDRDTAIRQGVVSFCCDEHRKEWWDDQRTRRKVQAVRNREANRAKGEASAPKASRSNPTGRLRPRTGVHSEARRYVFIGDDWRCRMCRKSSDALQCHHVVYRSEAPKAPWLHEPSNLISLCQECHDKVHSNKRRWQPGCLGIVWLREVENDRATSTSSFERDYADTLRAL